MNKKDYRYFDLMVGLFVAILLISNIASTKIVALWRLTFDGGTILFPFSYILGNILTEVYGYDKTRRVIWIGFLCAALMSATLIIIGVMRAAPGWDLQDAYMAILGQTPRIVAASLVAYFLGAFSNSYILAKLKLLTRGRWLFARTIGSTVIGQAIDTVVFVLIAFSGLYAWPLIGSIIGSNYVFKIAVEVVFTPAIYKIAGFLKRREKIDFYDYRTNFNPFHFWRK